MTDRGRRAEPGSAGRAGSGESGGVRRVGLSGPGSRPVVLVGLMGAGKTTVGRRLATALGRPFHDSDERLYDRFGETAAEQHRRYGVGRLHQREAALLRQSLVSRPPPVIAAAASVVDDPDCRRALAHAYVVWLDAPPQVLAHRLADWDRAHGGQAHRPAEQDQTHQPAEQDQTHRPPERDQTHQPAEQDQTHQPAERDHRPRLGSDPLWMLTRQYERRAGHFAALADLRLDVSRSGPEQLVAAVLTAVTGTATRAEPA